MPAQKQEGGGGSCGTGNTLHLLHVKHKSVCDLPPEGHINILPAPRQSHSAHYRDTITKIQTDSFTYSLTAFVACLWVSKVAGPSLSPYGSFWSRAQFDFPSASLIKASWTFLWRDAGRKTREGKRSYCQTLDTVSDKSHKLVLLFLRPSLPPLPLCFLSFPPCLRNESMYTPRNSEKQKCHLSRKGLAKSLKRT